jgi:3-oxoacyl-[acyl-carrier protein] reductase
MRPHQKVHQEHGLGPQNDLAGKLALVTGGSRGIGRAIAIKLAAQGATVAVHYGHDERAANHTVTAIRAAGGRAVAVSAELGIDHDVDTLFANLASALASIGRPVCLDIVVNNAAIVGSAGIDDLTAAEYERVMAVNVRAPLFVAQRALPLMADHGRLIAISSLVTRTAPREIAYVMSKGALDAMVRTLAPEVGRRGITVNAVAPGLTETELMSSVIDRPGVRQRASEATALGRVGRPEDIADLVSLLASPRASWVTGQVIDASGGLFLRTSVSAR